MARLALYLLGAFQATLDEEPIAGFGSVKAQALLAIRVDDDVTRILGHLGIRQSDFLTQVQNGHNTTT